MSLLIFIFSFDEYSFLVSFLFVEKPIISYPSLLISGKLTLQKLSFVVHERTVSFIFDPFDFIVTLYLKI